MRPHSLAAYLALAFTLLSLLFTIILVEVVERAGNVEVKNSIGHGLGQLAGQTADKLDRGMFERYREVGLLAERQGLVGAGVDTAQRRAILEQVQRSYGYYAWIGLVDMQGAVVAATGGLLEGVNVGQRQWYKNALGGHFVDDVHEAVLLAKLLPRQEEPWRFVDVAFPYHGADGKQAGVLGAHLSWEWARDVERSIIAPIAARGKVDALIVSKDGKVLLGPKDVLGKTLSQPSFQAAQGNTDGYIVEKWPDGTSYLVGYSRSKGFREYAGLGWTVLVRQDLEDAYEPVRRLRRHALWSGLGLAFLFSLAGIFAAHRITQPLGDLARSAQRIQAGESVPLESGNDSFFEVEALAGSLNALVADLVRRRGELQELNASLEQRVAARTSELEQAMRTLRESGERIANIIEASNDAFIGADLEGRITDWNTQASRMFGWSRAEVLGKSVTMLLPQAFRAGMESAFAAFRHTGRSGLLEQRLERVVVNRDGVEFPVEMSASLAGEGASAFFSVFLHDISERQKIDRMKTEFVSTVSHELRTPLTSIRASLALLADGLAGELEPDVAALVNVAYQSCERLVRLVNDVLDMQKIQSGKMEFHVQVQPLLPVVSHAVEAMQGYARERGVALVCQGDDGADGLVAPVDRDRIEQVLTNLVSNAVKFSERGGTVTVRVGAHAGRARIDVADQGCGIPPEFRDQVFKPFAQADSADSRRKGGTGLGLSICQSLVEQHGGRIGFDSEAGKGTVFWVELPLAS